MAEEQDDPCLIVLDLGEDEEEPSPEFGVPGLGIPGIGNILEGVIPGAGVLGAVDALNMENNVERFLQSYNTLMEFMPGFRNAVLLSGAGNRSEILSQTSEPRIPGTDRVLEDDVSLTPTNEDKSVGGKSTWLLNNTTLLGNRVLNENGKILFDSKPANHLARSSGQVTNRFPCNIIDAPRQNELRTNDSTKEIHDPLRWVSDKAWFNSMHVDGPVDFESIMSARLAHNKQIGREFYYINQGIPLKISDAVNQFAMGNNIRKHAYKVWGTFYEDLEKASYFATYEPFKEYRESDPTNWSGHGLINALMNNSNFLSLDIVYESHALLNVVERPMDWNWAHYLFGYVPEDYLRGLLLSTGAEDINGVYMTHARNESVNPESAFHWRNIYKVRHAIDNKSRKSLNLFPVIPFIQTRYFTNEKVHSFPAHLPMTVANYRPGGREMYYDMNTNIPDLLTKEESEILQIGSKAYFDIRPVYNYYDCLYEKVFSPVLNEIELPSPYSEVSIARETPSSVGYNKEVNLDAVNQEKLEERLFSKLVAADSYFKLGAFPSSAASRVPFQGRPDLNLEGVVSRDENSIRDFAEHMTLNGQYDFILNNNARDVLLSTMSTEELDAKYESRYMNPMFVEIELGHVQKSQLAEALTFEGDDTLAKHLFTSVLEANTPTDSQESYSFVEQLIQSQFSNRVNNQGGTQIMNPVLSQVFPVVNNPLDSVPEVVRNPDDTRVSETIPLTIGNVLDMSEWWKGIFDRIVETSNESIFVSPIERLANVLRLLTIKLRIKRIVNSSLRSYPQFMNGEQAKNEVLGFIVEKYEVITARNQSSLRHVSNFYILSNNNREVERFVDTQVKYGAIYEYRIHRVVAVFGNKYMYLDNLSQVERSAESAFSYNQDGTVRNPVFNVPFGVANMPCPKLFVVPTEAKRVSVVDSPPVFPNVEFIPYRNEKNSILIAMTSNSGKFSAPPVILEDDDKLQFLKVALAQGVPGAQSLLPDEMSFFDTQLNGELTDVVRLIEFKNDDPATNFEIFRLDEYPKTLLDFRDAKKTKISKTSDSCMYRDSIKPDKKYYYVFRVEDIHNHVSNPTHVYEVILRTYDEAVRLEIKVIIPENIEKKKKATRQSTKNLRQFLHLKPTLKHRAFASSIDGRFSTLQDNPGFKPQKLLGPGVSEKVWDKKFKLRIRSINTGKEVDVDFRFIPKLIVEENKKENLIC